MQNPETKKIVYIIIATVVVFALAMVFFKVQEEKNNKVANNNPLAETVQENPEQPAIAPTQATLSGTYTVCLPKHDNFSNEECIAGMKTDDGSYYALDFNQLKEKPELSEGTKLTASGTITPVEMLSSDRLRGTVGKGVFSVSDPITVDKPEANDKPASATPAAGPITVRGMIVCLPHKDEGAMHTMECAFGLKADNGTYYGLKDTDPEYRHVSSAPMDVSVEVKGNFKPGASGKYKDIGTIEISSITKL